MCLCVSSHRIDMGFLKNGTTLDIFQTNSLQLIPSSLLKNTKTFVALQKQPCLFDPKMFFDSIVSEGMNLSLFLETNLLTIHLSLPIGAIFFYQSVSIIQSLLKVFYPLTG